MERDIERAVLNLFVVFVLVESESSLGVGFGDIGIRIIFCLGDRRDISDFKRLFINHPTAIALGLAQAAMVLEPLNDKYITTITILSSFCTSSTVPACPKNLLIYAQLSPLIPFTSKQFRCPYYSFIPLFIFNIATTTVHLSETLLQIIQYNTTPISIQYFY